MPAHRKTNEEHELSGAWEKNPNRRRPAAPKSENPFGSAPKYFAKDEKVVWKEISDNSAHGVLTSADRILVETLCLLIAQQRRREPMKVAERGLIVNGLAKLGMTPVDRTRLGAQPDEDKSENPYSEFIN